MYLLEFWSSLLSLKRFTNLLATLQVTGTASSFMDPSLWLAAVFVVGLFQCMLSGDFRALHGTTVPYALQASVCDSRATFCPRVSRAIINSYFLGLLLIFIFSWSEVLSAPPDQIVLNRPYIHEYISCLYIILKVFLVCNKTKQCSSFFSGCSHVFRLEICVHRIPPSLFPLL